MPGGGGAVEVLDVAIVGGGPGGLAAANSVLLAAQHDLRVRVFERARRLRPVGFTLGLMGNGYNALESIHPAIYRRISDATLPDGPVVMHNHRDEETMRQPSATRIFKAWNSRVGHIPWCAGKSGRKQLRGCVSSSGCCATCLGMRPGMRR